MSFMRPIDGTTPLHPTTTIDSVPAEIVVHILSFLDLRSLRAAERVSKKWQGLVFLEVKIEQTRRVHAFVSMALSRMPPGDQEILRNRYPLISSSFFTEKQTLGEMGSYLCVIRGICAPHLRRVSIPNLRDLSAELLLITPPVGFKNLVDSMLAEFVPFIEDENAINSLPINDRPNKLQRLVTRFWQQGGNFIEAERVANTILNNQVKSQALSEVSIALSDNYITESARVAYTIPDGDLRSDALKLASLRLCHLNVVEAQRAADAIPNEHKRYLALQQAAIFILEKGNIAEVERIATTITDEQLRSLFLTCVSNTLSDMHNVPDAQRIAQTIPDETLRSSVLSSIQRTLLNPPAHSTRDESNETYERLY